MIFLKSFPRGGLEGQARESAWSMCGKAKFLPGGGAVRMEKGISTETAQTEAKLPQVRREILEGGMGSG